MTMKWEQLPSPFPSLTLWGAQKRGRSYIISLDTACEPSEYLNRYAVSVQRGRQRNMLGTYDTLEQAKSAAETGGAVH